MARPKFRRMFVKGRFKKAAKLVRGTSFPVRLEHDLDPLFGSPNSVRPEAGKVEDLYDHVIRHDQQERDGVPSHPEDRTKSAQQLISRTLSDAGHDGLAFFAVPHNDPGYIDPLGKVSIGVGGDVLKRPVYHVSASVLREEPHDAPTHGFNIPDGSSPTDATYLREMAPPKTHEIHLIRNHATRSQKAVAQIVRDLLRDGALVESEHPAGSERAIIEHLIKPARMGRDGEPVRMATPGSDEWGLLRGVHASPEDVAPRLVSADWHDEHGNHTVADALRRHASGDRKSSTLNELSEAGIGELPASHLWEIARRHHMYTPEAELAPAARVMNPPNEHSDDPEERKSAWRDLGELFHQHGWPTIAHVVSSGGHPASLYSPTSEPSTGIDLSGGDEWTSAGIGPHIRHELIAGRNGDHGRGWLNLSIVSRRGNDPHRRFEINDPATMHALIGELKSREVAKDALRRANIYDEPSGVRNDTHVYDQAMKAVEDQHPDKVQRIDRPERMARPKPGIWTLNTIPATGNRHLGRGEPYYGFVPREDWLEPTHFRGTELPSNSLAGKERERIQHEEDSTGWVPVTSSWIIGLRRFQGSSAVDMMTKDGREYRYTNTPAGLYQRFLGAGSKGKFWHAEISHYFSPAQKLAGKGGTRLKSAVKRLLTLKRRVRKVP